MIRRIFDRLSFLAFAYSLAPIMAFAEEGDLAGQGNGGSSMPQLDPTYYASQIFWLVISAGLLYLAMAKLALPRISAMVDRRENRIQQDLEQSYQLKHQAEDLKIAYTNALRDADEKAATLVDQTVKAMKDRHEAAMASLSEQQNARIAQTEGALVEKKQDVLANLDTMTRKLAQDIVSVLEKRAEGN